LSNGGFGGEPSEVELGVDVGDVVAQVRIEVTLDLDLLAHIRLVVLIQIVEAEEEAKEGDEEDDQEFHHLLVSSDTLFV
jgi:hypothetical protein